MFLCQEIINEQAHPNPQYFEDFQMRVYCFSNPTNPEQVKLLLIYFVIGSNDPWSYNRIARSWHYVQKNGDMASRTDTKVNEKNIITDYLRQNYKNLEISMTNMPRNNAP